MKCASLLEQRSQISGIMIDRAWMVMTLDQGPFSIYV